MKGRDSFESFNLSAKNVRVGTNVSSPSGSGNMSLGALFLEGAVRERNRLWNGMWIQIPALPLG